MRRLSQVLISRVTGHLLFDTPSLFRLPHQPSVERQYFRSVRLNERWTSLLFEISSLRLT